MKKATSTTSLADLVGEMTQLRAEGQRPGEEFHAQADYEHLLRENADTLIEAASLLVEAERLIEGLADQQAMADDFYVEPLARIKALVGSGA